MWPKQKGRGHEKRGVAQRGFKLVVHFFVCQLTDMAASFVITEDVPDAPHQPDAQFRFPKRSFGKKTLVHRSFQHSWFGKWPFLHYKETVDVVYCHTCLLMFKEKKAKSATKADQAFVS